jgi:PAS domain S-box-containing protein
MPAANIAVIAAFAILSLVLLGVGKGSYPNLHTVLDTAVTLSSFTLALVLWGIGSHSSRSFPKCLAVVFAFSALLEFVHVLTVLDWSGPLAFIAEAQSKLRPVTGPPGIHTLPLGIGYAIWRQRQRRETVIDFVLVMGLLTICFFVIFEYVPLYVPSTFLGMTRPSLALAPILCVLVAAYAWKARFDERKVVPLIWMLAILAIAYFMSLFSTTGTDGYLMSAHVGQIAARLVLLISIMQIAAGDVRDRLRMEESLGRLNAELEGRVVERTHRLGALSKQLEQETTAAVSVVQRLHRKERALEAINQAIAITEGPDIDAPIIYANSRFADMTGYALGEIEGRRLREFLPDLPASVRDRTGFESKGKHKNGKTFLSHVGVSTVFDEKSKPTHFVAAIEDITEVRKREEMLREAQKMETVGQLTGGIAHDFNNLLAVIQSNAEDLHEVLHDDPDSADQADLILKAARRGADLVKQLLAFSRKQELSPQVCEVASIIQPFAKLLRRTFPENITFQVNVPADLPRLYLDPGMLENALLNLAVNARDAMPDGGLLTIEARTITLDQTFVAQTPELKTGTYIQVAVSDTGSGMPPNVVKHAFEPFFTTKAIGKGTGLGLSMVYGFVRQSGGQAKIYSELGKGTTIKLFLPISAESAETAASRPLETPPPKSGSGAILLVEDDDLVRESVANKLRRLGYSVTCTATAAEGLLQIEKYSGFVLVFSDVIMPGTLTGADLAREIRNRWPRINILLTSGYTASAALGRVDIPEGIKLLSKPYSNADLAAAVHEAVKPAA